MASETDFLNNALGKAGCGAITALDEESVNARWCRVFYPSLRRATQRTAKWKFCDGRMQLQLMSEAPLFGYLYSYALPSQLIRLNNYNGVRINVVLAADPTLWSFQSSGWKIEGRKLFSNDSVAYVEYTQEVTNPDHWDPLYYEMLADWLGSNLALAIRHDTARHRELQQSAMGMWMPLALAVDGQEASVEPYRSDDLIWGRF